MIQCMKTYTFDQNDHPVPAQQAHDAFVALIAQAAKESGATGVLGSPTALTLLQSAVGDQDHYFIRLSEIVKQYYDPRRVGHIVNGMFSIPISIDVQFNEAAPTLLTNNRDETVAEIYHENIRFS